MDPNEASGSSKALLYSEYTGSTVVEHVLKTLNEKPRKNLRLKIEESFKKKEKSATFERVRQLMKLIDKEQDLSTVSENPKDKSNDSVEETKNQGEIEVVMEVNENCAESNVDAWFLFKVLKEQESKCSDNGELVKRPCVQKSLGICDSSDISEDNNMLEKTSPAQKNLGICDSSDISDNEDELKKSVPAQKYLGICDSSDNSDNDELRKPSIGQNILDSRDSSDNSDTDDKLKKTSVGQNILDICDLSGNSDDESDQNYPVITNGFALKSTDSSNSSLYYTKSNLFQSSGIKNALKFSLDSSSSCSSEDDSEKNFDINLFSLNQTNYLASSSHEPKLNPYDFSKIQNFQNVASDDSSDSLDVENEQCLSVSTMNGNVNCQNNGILRLSVPLKKNKRIFEIPDTDSSEDLEGEIVNPSSSNAEIVPPKRKKMSNFALNNSSSSSFDECEQNNILTNRQRDFIKGNYSDNYSVVSDASSSVKG